ncbi:MAG TPA: 2-oxoglutarate dehydrogenase E1 component [Thiotrichaceae bacterium]|jgi:2-oxoglutarate dehydrogenase E1 component|nr:2-oxoglutarate dehydrogenase E1 component [Thiotrichaceae bacterium]HIM07469.1 2-oxoglutarate dehydrogenase E1 component [Gammaproteobacteria bacterium]
MKNTVPSYLYSGNAWFVEELYESYLSKPESIDPHWRDYFDSLQDGTAAKDIAHTPIQQAYANAAKHPQRGKLTLAAPAADAVSHQKQTAVLQLINAHRFNGHRQSDLDPLKQYQRPEIPELDPAYHGLTEEDMEKTFNTGSLFAPDEITLREIVHIIKTTYCNHIGAEYMHINETEQKRWLQKRLEESLATPNYDKEERIRILDRVIDANALEEYLHTKYVGQKRFSVEGGESLIPLLNEIIQSGGAQDIKEIVIGMAHRGRLNVLVNIIGKKPSELFDEFEGKVVTDIKGSGDVKYHKGYSSDISTPGGSVHLTLAFNPSHLEIIDPVVEGSVRARQDRRSDHTHNEVLPILIHGDAAFAGQGVIMETFNLSQTRGYTTGGTVHVIINNQIGFTTSDPLDSRSSLYCTDVAKMVQAPIFHVNGDDPEAVVFVTRLALDFRMEFNKDVVVDMVCYRKHGHSEADDPMSTQPIMYQQVRKHPGVRKLHTDKLIAEGVITQEGADAIAKEYIDSLESNQGVAGTHAEHANPKYLIDFSHFIGTKWDQDVDTTISETAVKKLSELITTIPDGFALSPAVKKIIENRVKMGNGEMLIDWGFAETMAYASLIDAGYPIRLSGQDSGRGTFFHRHAVLHNMENGKKHLPLQHIKKGQPEFRVINSTLSEEAVLAYEYGYSSAEPNALVIWEAQFGDFANGAQVVFDQFISSCESKWGRFCGLTVMLPHSYDGQGPEHSSARLERFLQLCAEQNMQVCFPSTPAQMFHMLRRQILRPYRKPLIIMSPKSLLRRKLSSCPVDELIKGKFQTVINEIDDIDSEQVTRLLFCSGKVYFDLLEQRRESNITNIAISRIEQLFPFPHDDVKTVLNSYPNLKEVVWVQEEPKNQGSWYYMQSRGTMIGVLSDQHTFGYAGRFYSASPATGLLPIHNAQQKQLVSDALQLGKLEVTSHK